MVMPNPQEDELGKKIHALFYEQAQKYPVDSSEIRWNFQEAMKLIRQYAAKARIDIADDLHKFADKPVAIKRSDIHEFAHQLKKGQV